MGNAPVKNNSAPARGGCFCGEIAFEFDGDADALVHCHCGMCRRMSGAAFTTWISVPRRGFRLLKSASLKSFSPSHNSKRHFCSACGTHVFTEDARYCAILGIPAGVLHDSPLPALPQVHYFVSDKAPWHEIADDLPRYGGLSGFERLEG
jgi:hypothetical protein